MTVLDQVPSICYPIQFEKDKGKDVLALFDSRNEVNVITLSYTAHLGFKMRKTDVHAQKINRSSLETYGMFIAIFQVFDKLSCSWFFQATFLLTDISIEMVLSMFFLTLGNADI